MDKSFVTKDLYLSSFLLLNGFAIKDHFRNGNSIFFKFDNSAQLQGGITEYLSGSAQIEPLAYLEKMKVIKRIIFNDVFK